MGQAIESLQPAACRSTLSTHLDGVPSALQRAEITPVEPDPANTGVGIEMRRSIVSCCPVWVSARLPLRFPARLTQWSINNEQQFAR